MITRRCTQRQFLLRPDELTNRNFLYCLAEAANRYNIRILFTLANSNHHHTGIYDAKGNYPAFIEHFHKMLAKCQNARFGRWENFWASEQTSVVRLVDKEDVLDKMVYALTNPVKDHLVERAHHWPGVSSRRENLSGEPMLAERPRKFFRAQGGMPQKVRLELGRPPAYEHLTRAEFAALLEERITRAEKEAAEERRKRGIRVLGRAAVLAQSWQSSPQSIAPRRGLSPRVAAKSRWSRIEALQRLEAFVRAHRAAWQAWKGGVRDVLFPAGTYWLVHFAGVECATE